MTTTEKLTITQKLREESRELRRVVQQQVVGYILTGLGLVAALAWNDAIQTLIKVYLPLDDTSVWAKVTYAFLMTLIIVVATVYLTRWFKKE